MYPLCSSSSSSEASMRDSGCSMINHFSSILNRAPNDIKNNFHPRKESRDVWDLSELAETLKENPVDTPYVCYRKPSYHRQHRVIVVDEVNRGEFFVNLRDIERASPVLRAKLDNIDQFGRKRDFPTVRCGVIEFEILLRIICNSYDGLSRVNAIGKYMHRMLVLSKRWKIPSLISECERHIRSADYAHVSVLYAVKWFNAYEQTELDEFFNPYTGAKTRPIRSHIICEMLNVNRWNQFSQNINQKYANAVRERFYQHRFSTFEVDFLLSKHLDFNGQQINPLETNVAGWTGLNHFHM